MARFQRLALLGLAGAAFAVPVHAQTTLTMSSWVPPSHPLTKEFLQGWANEAEKVTGGRVRFQMLPKAPVAPPGTFDGVRDGQVDLSYVTASYTPARHTLPKLGELPGGGSTATINSIAYSRIHWKHLHQVGEYNGVHLIGVFSHGPGQIFNTKLPVTKVADLAGLKIRTGGGIAADMGKALGASMMFKPAPESYEILKTGVADGLFFPLESPASFKLEKLIKYATIFPGGFYSSTFGFFMNPGKWDKLPKQDQDALKKISGEWVARFAGGVWDKADQGGLDLMKRSGTKIHYASPAFVKDVMAKADPVIEEWIAQANAKGVDGPKVLAEFRAEVRRLSAK
jgi:TRAP-type C4-dicarboxylate transport system substrate-binding protein